MNICTDDVRKFKDEFDKTLSQCEETLVTVRGTRSADYYDIYLEALMDVRKLIMKYLPVDADCSMKVIIKDEECL